jgi:hypothetical protein
MVAINPIPARARCIPGFKGDKRPALFAVKKRLQEQGFCAIIPGLFYLLDPNIVPAGLDILMPGVDWLTEQVGRLLNHE